MSTHVNPPPHVTPPPPSYPGRRGAPPPTVFAAPPPPPDPTGIPAYGTLIQVLSSPAGITPETYASIAGLGDITGPNPQVAETETTSHSTGSPHRTFIPTLIDDGQISFPMYWHPNDPTQSESSFYGLQYLFENRIVTKFRIVNTDVGHRTRIVQGYVKQLNETYPLAGICTMQTIIRCTGPAIVVPSAISITPDNATATGPGGPSTFDVVAGGSLSPWTALPDVPWISITTPVGETVGDSTVDYTVAAQATGDPARVGHINIGALNLVFTVSQAAG